MMTKATVAPVETIRSTRWYDRPQSMKGQPFYKRDESGQYYFDFAEGGKIHRGRRAGKSAEKKNG